MGKKDKSPKKEESPDTMSSGELPQQTSKEKKISFHDLPPLPLPDKKIHPRQVIPPISEGKETPDHTPSPPVDPEE